MKKEQPVLEFYLSNFIQLFLGNQDCKPIPIDLAREITSKKDWQEYCHVQFEVAETGYYDYDSKVFKLEHPLLWNKKAWFESNNKQELARKYAHKRRIEEDLFRANVRIVARAVSAILAVEGDAATTIASKLLYQKKDRQIKALGVHKLLTREDEL